MEIEYFKSPARLLDRDQDKGGLDLAKEVLWVSVGQRAAELQVVKVGYQKNSANWTGSNPLCPRWADRQNFFLPPTLTALKTAAL